MKRFLVSALILAASSTYATDIMLSKAIKSDLRDKIQRDLEVVNGLNFKNQTNPNTLKIMGLNTLNAQTASQWLDQRVNYVISENALSIFNLLIMRVIYTEQKNVEYPYANITPYSLENTASTSLELNGSAVNEEKAMTVMSNIGSALYLGGKTDKVLYGMRISRGLFRLPEKVAVNSPRSGIIQIGEGLFSPDLTINKEKPEALSNTIFRMGTFFHEARHSDGHGESLGFLHATCPKGHDYEGVPACDENLNGPYSVGSVMMAEMARSCDEQCSEKEKQTLKLMVLDSANRILTTTHKGDKARNWDPTPESL